MKICMESLWPSVRKLILPHDHLMIFFRRTVALSLCLFFFVPSLARAFSVGISPAEVSVTVLQGTKQEIKFTVMRSDASSGQNIFTMTTEGDPIIDTSSVAPWIIPSGSREISAPITIDAREVPLGEYEALVRFVQEPDFSSAGSTKVLIGVTAKVRVHVVDRSTYVAHIADNGLEALEFSVPTDVKARSLFTLVSRIRNTLPVSMEGLTYRYLLLNTSGQEFAREEQLDMRLAAYETVDNSIPFSLEREGDYFLRMQVFYGPDLLMQAEQPITVGPADNRSLIPIIGVGILVVFAGWNIFRIYRSRV